MILINIDEGAFWKCGGYSKSWILWVFFNKFLKNAGFGVFRKIELFDISGIQGLTTVAKFKNIVVKS